jgi:hypothetical protein
VVSIHPPWWASVWFILLIAVLWYFLFVYSTRERFRRMFDQYVQIEQQPDGTWQAVATPTGRPVAYWSVKVSITRGLIWTKVSPYSSLWDATSPSSLPPPGAAIPTEAQAAAAWLLADDEGRATGDLQGRPLPAPFTLREAVLATTTGQEAIYGNRWAYEIRTYTWWLPFAAVPVAALLIVVRLRRKLALENIVMTVQADLCARCGYSLKGISALSVCPECGADNEAIRQEALAELGRLPR